MARPSGSRLRVSGQMVIAGRGIDRQEVSDLGRISSAQLALRYGDDIVASTIPALREPEVANQLRDQAAPEQVQIAGERYWGSLKTLTPNVKPAVSLIVLKSDREAMASLAHLNRLLLALGLVAVFSGGALVFAICDRFTRPLGSLVGGVGALEKGDFEYRLNARGSDEVAQLTRAFGRMRSTLKTNEVQRQKLEDHLRQSQKMEAIGRLAGGVAHDFNNLLMVISGYTEVLLDQLAPENALHAKAEAIQQASDRATTLTRQLLAFSRKQLLELKVIDVNAIVADMERLLRPLIGEDIELTTSLAPAVGCTRADAGQLEQVIMNLVVNAKDAMHNGGKICIRTASVTLDDTYRPENTFIKHGPYVMISVSDTGQGMDRDTQARIFEPFFTTKEKGKGTGLGLSTVYGIIKQSGGYVFVQSELGRGTVFTIYFPRVDEPSASLGALPASLAAVGGAETILLVEDEESVRQLVRETLESRGYHVLEAANGQDALAVAASHADTIHLIITDVVMPGLSGHELVQKLLPARPGTKVLYLSGYAEDAFASPLPADGKRIFLQKPFTLQSLSRRVREVLGPATHKFL